jgi:nitrite reductase/ring-hydroxylating ferredoxin subunit
MTTESDRRWWALARSEEVTAKRPLAADIGDQPVVLWRDAGGAARALEDRCPHRRAPLSLGCVRANGWIQCGYHGWSFDGATGRLAEIPNIKGAQRFPPLYRARGFGVAESGGFVRVCLDAQAPPPPAPTVPLATGGTTHVALDHDRYIAAMFDDPGLLLSIRLVHFTTYLQSELKWRNGWLEMERSCQWRGLRAPAAFSGEFPLSLLTRTDPDTGETALELRDTALRPLLTARIAPVPAARGVTAVRWRAQVARTLHGAPAKTLALGAPLHIRAAIDAAKLRRLVPSASLHGATLRAEAAAARAA